MTQSLEARLHLPFAQLFRVYFWSLLCVDRHHCLFHALSALHHFLRFYLPSSSPQSLPLFSFKSSITHLILFSPHPHTHPSLKSLPCLPPEKGRSPTPSPPLPASSASHQTRGASVTKSYTTFSPPLFWSLLLWRCSW